MKVLAQIEIRCRAHESVDPQCTACQLLRRAERNYQRLRTERARMLAELRAKLVSRELIILDLS